MHRFKKFILLIVVFFIVQFFFTTVNAENNVVSGEANYTQKIVSILYDNSGSMDIGDKTKYALYSLQTLIGLMDEKDELIVCPMNISGTANTNTDKCLHVDLTNPNREQEIKKVIENKNLTNPYGSTPISSIDTAISTLVEKGLTKISDGNTFSTCYSLTSISLPALTTISGSSSGRGINGGTFNNCTITINTISGGIGINDSTAVKLYLTRINCATIKNLSNTGGKLNVLNNTVLHAS